MTDANAAIALSAAESAAASASVAASAAEEAVDVVAAGGGTPAWSAITGKPTEFTPSDTGVAAALNSGAVTKPVFTSLVNQVVAPVSERANTSSRAVASGYGFAVEQIDAGHWFLNFDPSDSGLIASMTRTPGGRKVGKSTDTGATWTTLGEPSTTNYPASLWVTAAGHWFAYSANAVRRSTDAGATWTNVLTTTGSLLGQGFAEESDGTLWVVEYQGDATVWRSTDDGVTWAEVYDFPNTDNASGTDIRHAHGVAALPSGVWVMTGDNNTQCGLWRYEGGTLVRKTPALTDANGAQHYRAVGLAERDGWLYWVQDGAAATSPTPPAIVKANPADFPGTLTVLAELPSGGWYIDALPTGELVAGSVTEGIGQEDDRNARLWVIDNDDKVHEVWSAKPATGLSGDFIALRNLHVRSDGLVACTVNQTDFTGPGSTAYATVLGRVVPGGRPQAATMGNLPKAYPASTRTWKAVPTTAAPTITGATFTNLPELSVPVSVRTLRPLLVSTAFDIRNNTAGQYTNWRVIARDLITGAVTLISPDFHSYGAQTYGTASLTGLWVPTSVGDFAIEVQWSASGASQGDGRALRRSLSVIEL